MAIRVYWVGLLILVRKLCAYWERYNGKMPSDLPSSVQTAMAALSVACAALQAYDVAKAHGKPENS